MPDAIVTDVISRSASHSWEAMMVAFFCIVVVGLLIWLIRHWMEQAYQRETRMATRIDALETFARETLLTALRDNTKALTELILTLHSRMCLLSPHEQNGVVKSLAMAIKEELHK